MIILTDFPRFPHHWRTSDGTQGEANTALGGASSTGLWNLLSEIRRADLILVHESGSKLFRLVLLFWVLPFLRKPIVSVDLLLRKPHTTREKLGAWLRKILLSRVDHFIHYFQKLDGYETFFGISPGRSSYVPFKANIFGDPEVAQVASETREEFVFSAGWSLREYDTFLEAISQLNYPSAIPRPDFLRLQQHGARFTWKIENLPPNLVLLEHDGQPESWLRNLCRARVVVSPILRDTLRSAGISLYLDAMLLKKCVIISAGPGVSELLTDQAIVVPPEDPDALVQAIRKVWENPDLREATALRGQRYAASLGGEPQLMQRILDRVVNWHSHIGS